MWQLTLKIACDIEIWMQKGQIKYKKRKNHVIAHFEGILIHVNLAQFVFDKLQIVLTDLEK